jgi:hypothetical protein
VPARFLTDERLATYGRYAAGPPDQAVLERFFFLDDADRDLVAKRRVITTGSGGRCSWSRFVMWGRSWPIRWMCR